MYHLDNFELYKGNIDGYDVVYPEYDLNPTELLDNLWAYDTEFDGLVLENSWPLDVANKSFNGTDLLLPYFNKVSIFLQYKNVSKYKPTING